MQPKREPGSEQDWDGEGVRPPEVAGLSELRDRERDNSSKESTPQRTFGRKRKKGAAGVGADNMSSAASTCSEDSMSERGSDNGAGTYTTWVFSATIIVYNCKIS